MDNNFNENQQQNAVPQQNEAPVQPQQPMYVEQPVQAQPQQPAYTQQPVQQNNPFMDSTAYQQPVNYAPVQAIQPKSRRGLVITLVCVAAVLLVVGVFFLFQMLNKTTYEKAERAYFAKMSDSAEGMLENALEENKKLEFTVSYGDGFAELVGAESEIDLSALEDYTYTVETAAQGNVAYAVFNLVYGGTDVLDGKMWVDSDAQSYVMAFPEILDKYLVSGVTASGSDAATDEQVEAYFELMGKWFEKVSDKYFELFGGAEISDKGTKTVNGVIYSYDVMTVEFTDVKLAELIKEAYVVLRNDEELVTAFAEMTETPVEEFKASLDETIADMESDETEDDAESTEEKTLFTMDVYLSGGEIVGREISVAGIASLEFFNMEQGNDYANVVDFSVPIASISFNITDAGIKSGDAMTGSVTFELKSSEESSMNSFVMNAAYTDMKADGSGEFKLSVPSKGFEVSYKGSAEAVEIGATMGGKEVFTVTGTISDSSLAFEAMPEVNDENSVNISDGDSDEISQQFEEYFESLGLGEDLNANF